MPDGPDELQSLVDQLLQSRKYREMDLAPQTVRDLLEQELPRHRKQKDALDAVRTRLHNIVAPYLGDPDYAAEAQALDEAFNLGQPEAAQGVCHRILSAHASTKERLPILETFYQGIFAAVGQPDVILDLACGLNPFAFPWMGLPRSVRYYAYDIHRPRLDLINHYFGLQGLAPLAVQQDILVEPPQVEAPVAFFFKEAHRFEQRQHGSSRRMWQALRVRFILVSLPTSSLSGKYNLLERQRALVAEALDGLNWPVRELIFANEMVFVIEKGACG